jgi:hypothetical protein
VDEGAGLQELQRRGGAQGGVVELGGAARAAPAPVAERGPQALAAGQEGGQRVDHRDEVVADAGENRRLVREHLVDDHLDACPQVGDVEGAGSVGHPPSLWPIGRRVAP